MKQKNKKISALAFCFGIILIGLFLHTGGFLKGNRIVFPGLPEIGQAFLSLLSSTATYRKIGITLLHVSEALVISAGTGILIGLAEGRREWVYSLFRPVMVFLRSIPMIVLVIIIMSAISYHSVPVAATCLILIPIFSEAVYEGCHSISQELIDVYRMNGGFSLQVAIHVYLPLISGYLKQAFINASGTGIKVAISAEYLVQTRDSLGKAVFLSSYSSEYAEIYAYALIMIFLVLIITEVPGFLYKLYAKIKRNNITIPG